jgi:hypothetical protein
VKQLNDARLDAASKLQRLNDEVKEIKTRIDGDEDSPQIRQRGQNLIRGLERAADDFKAAETAYHDALLKGVMNGAYGLESGDGAAGAAGDRRLARERGQGRSAGAKSALADAVLDAGFDLKSKPSVEIDGFDTLVEMKATTVPGVDDWNRRPPGAVVPLGQDRRFLWPFLPSLAAGNYGSIEDFQQTARELTGTVQRTLNATTDKASLATTTTLVNTALVEFAVTLDDIPNAVLESVPQLTAFMASEGEFQVMKAIDAHVMAQIVAATPDNGLTGTNLITQLRNGISAMRAVGAQPTLAVLNPTDSVTLDTYQESDGAYLFATRSTNTANPLWDLQIIERIGAGTEEPFLIDPVKLGVLYLGSLRFDADPYTGFKKNLTTLRVEIKGLFHIRNIQGAYEIVA